ncbi:MAG: addiction module protein [Deferrisomatales bacterium]
MSLHELESQIRKLSLRDRAELARWLLESLDEVSEEDVEALWGAEGERRLDEMEQGRVEELPAAEVFRRARAALR